jgi:RNA polymerase sigma-70 factor (ECF subfamily)
MTDILTNALEDQPAPVVQAGNDEALAREARENPAAFAGLYRRHVNRVYRYLLVRVGDVHDAQDLTAQTFLAALEGIAGYRGQGGFAAWLLGIARRKAADHFRRGRTTLPLEAAAHVPDPNPLPDAVAEQRLRLERMTRALRGLSPDRAEALSLRVFGGLNAAEVGRVMGRSEAAVRMLVHRAVRDLRERLAPVTEAER